MLIDHLGLDVADFNRSRAFYDAAFAPLQVAILYEVPLEFTNGRHAAGYGKTLDSRHVQAGKPSFWIAEDTPPATGVHVRVILASPATTLTVAGADCGFSSAAKTGADMTIAAHATSDANL